MKRLYVVILIILTLVVVVVFLMNSKQTSTLSEAESHFMVNDTSAITKLFIADRQSHEVLLERDGNGWVLNKKFPANTKVVAMTLGTLKNLKVKAPVPVAQQDNVIKRLSSTGIKVEVYQMVYRVNLFDKLKLFRHEKRTRVFYVGGATQNNLGTYFLMENAKRPYIAFIPSFRGFLSTRFSPLADDWKSHTVFRKTLSEIKSVILEFGREPEKSFRIDVPDNHDDFTFTYLDNGEKAKGYDTLKVLNFLTSFTDLRYETRLNNIKSPAAIDSIIHSPFLYRLTLIDYSNDTTLVTMFEKKEASFEDVGIDVALIPIDFDRVYGLINDGEDFVLLQYFIFDKVLKPASYFTENE